MLSFEPGSSVVICLIGPLKLLLKVRCSVRIGKRSRWRSGHRLPTGELLETGTGHITPSLHPRNKHLPTDCSFVPQLECLHFERKWGLSATRLYTTQKKKITMSKCDRDSSRSSLHFPRLERVPQADTNVLEAVFKLSYSLCLRLPTFFSTYVIRRIY